MNKILQVKDVSLKIPCVDHLILSKIDFEVDEGDFVVVLGGNGSGKSSLLKVISGAYKNSKGKILFEGKQISKMPSIQKSRDIVTLTQSIEDSLFFDMTVLDNAILWDMRHNSNYLSISKCTERKFYQEYFKNFNKKLSKKLDTVVARLSGGEKQSLILALCLKSSPKLLILDEHTSALDPKTAESIIQSTADEVTKKKITCLMTTHNLEHAVRYGNRLIAIKDGEIIYTADAKKKAKIKACDLLKFCY